MRAGEIVSAEEAERRVLMLVNPALKAPCTTDTIYSGLQLVLPGEIAPAHRHVAFALRFIIEGSRGFTAVSGEKIIMERGDVILTPSWKWHDHGNEGSEPVIWLDGLDLPVFQFLRLNFATNYPEPRYPSTLSTDSDFVYKWAPVEKALRETRGSYARYDYQHQLGGHLSQTISAQAERVAVGSSSPESQETLSFVYHVVYGQGYSLILSPGANQAQMIAWTSKDTFVVPAWSKVTHTCTSKDDDAFLFAINDRPMVEALGLWKHASTFSPSAELS
jgi:gentisate 1,2-dioxygenase